MLRTSSFLSRRIDLLAKTPTTDTHHIAVETYPLVASVPAFVGHVSDSRSATFGRYEYPVDRIAMIDAHPAAVVGNRVGFCGSIFYIIGVDDTKRMWELHLAKVVR